MLKDTADIRTKAYVLRRTNYGEADRILNLITPDRKISAIAKGVRKPKSKLAGGVEMFSLIEVNLHKGRGDLMTVTSAKMVDYFGNLLKDYNLVELATLMLKKINTLADSFDAPEYFTILDSSLKNLNSGANPELVYCWFILNVLKASGEEVNLYRDVSGVKLDADARYGIDVLENAFKKETNGEYGAEEIKILRLMLAARLEMVAKILDLEKYLPNIMKFTKVVSREM